MRKIIYDKFDKLAIKDFPVEQFPGRIIVVETESEAEKAVEYLLSQDILGMDTETKPSFTKSDIQHLVALLQVSTHDTCFLFRLNKLGMPPSILRLLEDTTVMKVGLSWHDDILSLLRRATFTPGYFIDIQNLVSLIGIKDLSLRKLYANIFHKRINKHQQLSNWERNVLNDKQMIYAATDAWSCIMLYEEIQRLLASGDYELAVTKQVIEQEHDDEL
ncbi:MAG: 3'-5' exonuclease domain-containing protein 2 [Prevotella sp.]|nr:3'-5' exonuclease domain-containing protein 2 [Prevotella sp.]MBQ6209834.1 3'-5' exonuclease domain-containing protein 2 [Prevotella sp.]